VCERGFALLFWRAREPDSPTPTPRASSDRRQTLWESQFKKQVSLRFASSSKPQQLNNCQPPRYDDGFGLMQNTPVFVRNQGRKREPPIILDWLRKQRWVTRVCLSGRESAGCQFLTARPFASLLPSAFRVRRGLVGFLSAGRKRSEEGRYRTDGATLGHLYKHRGPVRLRYLTKALRSIARHPPVEEKIQVGRSQGKDGEQQQQPARSAPSRFDLSISRKHLTLLSSFVGTPIQVQFRLTRCFNFVHQATRPRLA
jgi:hypothetical protein